MTIIFKAKFLSSCKWCVEPAYKFLPLSSFPGRFTTLDTIQTSCALASFHSNTGWSVLVYSLHKRLYQLRWSLRLSWLLALTLRLALIVQFLILPLLVLPTFFVFIKEPHLNDPNSILNFCHWRPGLLRECKSKWKLLMVYHCKAGLY